MTSTFFLKRPKSNKETLIIFSCYFKKERKKFLYSVGEKINPKNWSQENKLPILKGKNKAYNASAIKMQLNRHTNTFQIIANRCKVTGEEFTSSLLKKEFDVEFKKASTNDNTFYSAFEEFIAYKIKLQEWSTSTVKRYRNIKNILLDFEKTVNYNLTFNTINDDFHADFTNYCMNVRGHINNTYSRNLGLFKTFMFWAYSKGYTYNNSFKDFEKKKRVITKQIALSKIDLQKLMHFDFKNERLEKVRDVFVFSCVTGLRFGELRLFSKESIVDNAIILKEEKENYKKIACIVLNNFKTIHAILNLLYNCIYLNFIKYFNHIINYILTFIFIIPHL